MVTATSQKYETDRAFVSRILRGDEQAWAEFVDRYTDWVFCKANQWTAREKQAPVGELRKMRNARLEKDYHYSEAALDVYLWIFRQLRNKLRSYQGNAALSSYVWSVLHSQFLFVDYLRWRKTDMPRALEKCAKNERQVFVLMRENIPVEQIALALSLEIEEVLKIAEHITTLMRGSGQSEVWNAKEVELSEVMERTLVLAENRIEESHVVLQKVLAHYRKSLDHLSRNELQILDLFYNDAFSAEEILEAYKAAELVLPNGKASGQAVRKDIYRAIEKAKKRLLAILRRECRDLPDASINHDTVTTLLDQLGVVTG